MSKDTLMARLLGPLSGSLHPYTPSTLTFPSLNVEEIKRKKRIEARGKERGAQELPASDSDAFDHVENEIITLIEHERNNAANLFNDELTTYAERLGHLDLDSAASHISIEARKVMSNFDAELSSGADDVFSARRHLVELEREFNDFRRTNRLNRTAHFPESSVLQWSILLALLLIEAILNGFFLGQTHELGLVGGVTEAIIIALFNVGVGAVFGAFILRQCWHRRVGRKLVGLLGMAVFLAAIIGFNLAAAHYRDLLAAGAWEDAATQILPNLRADPLAVQDVKSWLLFAIGVAFSLVALVDGFKLDDPYPGYGKLWRKLGDVGEYYAELKAGCLEDLAVIKDEAVEAMRSTKEELAKARGEYNAIINARQRLCDKYRHHLDALEQAANDLLAAYREANMQARKTAPPPRFKARWKLERPSSPVFGELDQRRIDESVRRANETLEHQINEVHSAYDKAVRTFKRIEELSEEELTRGSAQAIVQAA